MDVASGIGALPASRRAAAISSAVRRAVPDGASALSGWCSSTTSTDSKNGAACAAKRIIRIAPMEKLGAISTPTPGRVGEPGLELVEPGLVEAGRADDGVDAVLDAEAQVVHHHVGVGEVHDHLGARPGELLDVVTGVDRGHQLGVGGRLDGPADLRADLAAGAQHADPDLCPDLCLVSCAHAVNRIGRVRIGVWRWLTRERPSGRLWAMPASTIPPRIKWAVDLMDVQPADQVLEIGCGPGAGAEAICAKLETGKLFAIDRSESGVDRTKRRNQKYVDAGRLVVRQIDLATLRVPVKRLNKVFAFNVNLFWVRPCDDEVALLHERVVPGGAVYLFYEAARPELVPNIVKKASENLLRGGFRVSVVEQKAPPVIGIIAKR